MLTLVYNQSLKKLVNNAMAVITDRKRPRFKQSQLISGGGGGLFGNILGGLSSLVNTFQAFVPEIVSTTEYYPFGMQMPGRQFSSNLYRYGFQGQEKTDEISGSGNHYTAEYWEYDPRLGRRWNVDPVVKHNESRYAAFANNPIWFIDPSGADTTISGSITAESEIMKAEGDPDFVPPGIKLSHEANLEAKIVNGKFTSASAKVQEQEYNSPVLFEDGIEPAFTEVRNYKESISADGLTATISYDVQTQLSNFEVLGQWVNTLFDDGTVQTNIITVTQSVEIVLKIGSITTTFDGSTFPESRYNASYNVDTETKMLKGTVNATLKQSSYYEAVKAATFRERNHPQKTRKTLTY